MTDSLISIRRVGKRYKTIQGGTIEALSGIDLEIQRGEFIALLGPSGCGKSTLLRVIAGLIQHSSGDVMLHGQPVREPSEKVGMVFQTPLLLPWRTVMKNALLAADLRKAPREECLQRVRHYLRVVGLEGFENRYPSELSGGMQQRASILRALVHDPEVLLMDEPFAALDAMTREHMQKELQGLWAESRKTIIFVTHSIPEAVFLADRVIVLAPRPGRVLDSVSIDLPRPRTLDMVNSDSFGHYVKAARRHFDNTMVAQ